MLKCHNKASRYILNDFYFRLELMFELMLELMLELKLNIVRNLWKKYCFYSLSPSLSSQNNRQIELLNASVIFLSLQHYML